MKKTVFLISLLCSILILTGCKKNNPSGSNPAPTGLTPTAVLTPTAAPTELTPTTAPKEAAEGTVEDYFPFLADTNDIYEGKGNEYAAFQTYVDFIDTGKKLIQIRTNNGGTETVKVLECKDGKLSVLLTKNECYYRDNLMKEENFTGKADVLLMEPLTTGTEWTLSDGSKRFISDTKAKIDTPSGKYTAIEVTTQEKDGVSKSYYAKNTGLVKLVYSSGDSAQEKAGDKSQDQSGSKAQDTAVDKSVDWEVTSTLSKRKIKTPFTQTIDFYYIDSDQNIHTEQRRLTFHTNDITRIKIREAMAAIINKKYVPLISPKTKINSLYLGKDNIVHADFSKEFISDMNLGAGYESMILQCIANTLGRYYSAEKVLLTVDNKPYSSGHIILKKGEALKVK